MTTTLPTPATPTSQLHYDPETRQWVGEISSTRGFGRVYDDACDEGLTLVGRTGRAVPYVVHETHADSDDIRGWLLKPVARADSDAGDLLLFND